MRQRKLTGVEYSLLHVCARFIVQLTGLKALMHGRFAAVAYTMKRDVDSLIRIKAELMLPETKSPIRNLIDYKT